MNYTVKRGDNLTKIAAQFGVSIIAIQAANPDLIKNIHSIKTGWVLNIPVEVEELKPAKPDLKTALNKCLADIEKLDSFKELSELL